MSDKRLDEQLMAHSETLYKLACAVGKLEAERDALQAKLDRIKQVSDFPAKTKEMAGYNSLIWKILEGKGDEL